MSLNPCGRADSFEICDDARMLLGVEYTDPVVGVITIGSLRRFEAIQQLRQLLRRERMDDSLFRPDSGN